MIPLDYYPNGKSFRSLYQRFEHRTPTAYTYYGYLAATLILQAISDIGNLDSRKQVMFNLVTNGPSTDLQTYTFDSNGDLSGTARTTTDSTRSTMESRRTTRFWSRASGCPPRPDPPSPEAPEPPPALLQSES